MKSEQLVVFVLYRKIGVGEIVGSMVDIYHQRIDPAIALSRDSNVKPAKLTNPEAPKLDSPGFRYRYHKICLRVYDGSIESKFLDAKIAAGYQDVFIGCHGNRNPPFTTIIDVVQ